MKHSTDTSNNCGLTSINSGTPLITTISIPDILQIRLNNTTDAVNIVVETGQYVLKGQVLTESDHFHCPPVHASSSGTVIDITGTCISIQTDKLDNPVEPLPAIDLKHLQDLIKLAHRSGIRGHGGAGFPLAAKLASLQGKPKLLLVNAAECDPAISCDDALISSRSDHIAKAIATIAAASGVGDIVIGVENDKLRATQLLQRSFDQLTIDATVSIISVPAQYPNGAEQLLHKLCCPPVPDNNGYLSESGVLSMNVASCYALGMAAINGLPCTSRITTVTINDRATHNIEALIGTPVSHIHNCVTPNTPQAEVCQISQGGEMMPVVLDNTSSISQVSNCISFAKHPDKPATIRPCIRCGECTTACPVQLLPQQLHLNATNFDLSALDRLDLERCLECRCCDVVCPSNIPLALQFKQAKSQKSRLLEEQQLADLAKQRFEKRQARLALIESGEKKKRARNQTTRKPAKKSNKDLIAQALQRKRQNTNSNDQPERD